MMRAVLHFDAEGGLTVYADEGVTVLSVSEAAPADRIYRMTPAPVPEALLDGPVGHAADGSPAAARAARALAAFEGRPHLSALPEGNEP